LTVKTPPQPSARRRLRRIQHDEIGLQIAPMIDVTLLLLFFFMLSGKLSGGVKLRTVDLPKISAELEEKNAGEREVLNVEAGGGLFLGERAVALPELGAYLRSRLALRPALKLHLRADAATPASRIKELLRVAAEAGVLDIVYGIRR
jgi:biopolymer transport protein ExbD